ncbi:UDP-N-acetylglucosamine 2-epimerase [Synechococcus lacustris]|uniref:UDP-N-acetylglucosamine 2-epimerase (Hydrolyzing) n=1 Tax=Synechococcus lacustris str. Tous TaxID=1910958 RepID=A0A2P7EBW7_9SYNE|nr:UDP-N-acetylglucosamine 2-epimerase [Synechococcus lacustris]PSI00629.1 UDP-N-acetylglucosamine 2-epimerase (hydrolyzing) [Synechococcus lacustris str. Tous]
MKRISVVLTARASYSRIKEIISYLHQSQTVSLELTVAGSMLGDKYGNPYKKVIEDGFNISGKCFNLIEGDERFCPPRSTANLINQLADVFEHSQPDLVITIADRFETIATAIAASYSSTCLLHIQGGETSGNIDDRVRHSITKLSDYHVCFTKKSRDNILRLGEDPSRVALYGCPSIDIARKALKSFEKSKAQRIVPLDFSVGTVFDESKPFIVILYHPVTDEYETSSRNTLNLIEAIERMNMPGYWFWPNADLGSSDVSKEIRRAREQGRLSKISFVKDLPSEDFLKLLIKSKALIGNSSVGIREGSFLAIPSVNIGNRQCSREKDNNVITCSYHPSDIVNAFHTITSKKIMPSEMYGNGFASKNIAEHILNLSPTLKGSSLFL